MKERIRRAVCLLLVLCMVAAVSAPARAATSLPDSVYLTQEGYSTCTLSATAMMLRARMYLGGNSQWSSITESGIKSTAWIDGMGMRWSFTYRNNGHSASVSYASVSGMSIEKLKGILDNHPEGIVLYCAGLPHAVFATDYEGDTFYCAEPVSQYSGRRIKLANSYLGDQYGSQETILSSVTAYWYVSSYSSSGSETTEPECRCTTDYAGEYVCNVEAGSSLNIRGGHGTGYSVVGSVPAGAVVTVTKASGTGSSDWAHVSYNGVSGFASMQYFSKKETAATALEITKQPADVTVDEGRTATVTVEARGDGLTYQWQYSESSDGGWMNSTASGSRSATLTLSGTADKNGLRYRCVITDKYGNTKTSGSATISVKSEVRECGCSANYAGEYICNVEAGSSLNIRSGHGTGYSVVGSIPSGAVVTVTKASGAGSSDWAHVTYNGVSGFVSMQYFREKGTAVRAPEITKHPQNASGTVGDSIRLSVEATGDGLSYQWQYRESGAGDWKNSTASGCRTAVLTIIAAEDSDGLRYRCVVTGADGTVRYSDAATLTIAPKTYRVSYNANGGWGAPGSQTKVQGTSLKLSSTVPTREGYRFAGWADSSWASRAGYQAGDSYTKDAGITLYAVWEKINTMPDGWVQVDGTWYYYQDDEKTTGWLQDGDHWYYLDDNGAMVTGAHSINGVIFMFGEDGVWEEYKIIEAEVWPSYINLPGNPISNISSYLSEKRSPVVEEQSAAGKYKPHNRPFRVFGCGVDMIGENVDGTAELILNQYLADAL